MKTFSIIIPIYNESESIFDLIKEIHSEFKKNIPELIIVDDGSNDDFYKQRHELKKLNVRILRHKKNLGKCRAMLTGISNARNNLICIMDGDGQNPPYEVKKMINFWRNLSKKEQDNSLICGNRKIRKDTFIKRLSSKVANTIRRFLLKDDCNDTACALKIFNRSDYLKIKYFRNMHRFLPALFKMNNCKIFNVQVDDRLRYSGVSKYSFNNRFWVGIIDLIKVYFLIKKGETNGD